MPQKSVDEVLASAKQTLSKAQKDFPSSSLATPAPKASPAAAAGKAVTSGAASTTGLGAELTAAKTSRAKATTAGKVSGTTPVMPSMHEGGPVPADGPYNLKAGEHVLTAPQVKMVRQHALMAVGMKKGLVAPASGATAGEPKKIDAAAKKPASKKATKGITVRPEKSQTKQIKSSKK